MSNIQNQTGSLLLTVSSVKRKYNGILKETGENFNVFEILGLTTKEKKTHSAFLAALLDPQGSHNKGTFFVEGFLDVIKKAFLNKNITIGIVPGNDTKVTVERSIGRSTDTDVGYIDILLTDNLKNHLIIENKINAGDQPGQLQKYHSFDPDAPLVYLTLDGKNPSGMSTGNNPEVLEKTVCISYRSDITVWLEKCYPECADNLILSATLKQYINVIRQLTNQAMNNHEKKEIIDLILSDKEKFEALEYLNDKLVWRDTINNIMQNVWERIICKNGIADDMNLLTGYKKDSVFGAKDFDFWFYREGWRYCIYFYFEEEFKTISSGIAVLSDDDVYDEEEKQKFGKRLSGLEGSTIHPRWIWKSNFRNYDNSTWYDVYLKGEKIIAEEMQTILDKVEDIM
jgi:hypothetical protein